MKTNLPVLFLSLALAHTAQAETVISKERMHSELANALSLLQQTKTFMSLNNERAIAHFRREKLIPFNQRIGDLSGADYAKPSLEHCRFYMQDIAGWFDMLFEFKTNQIDRPEFDRRRKAQKELMDIHGGSCDYALTTKN